jgi:hypothetical protein
MGELTGQPGCETRIARCEMPEQDRRNPVLATQRSGRIVGRKQTATDQQGRQPHSELRPVGNGLRHVASRYPSFFDQNLAEFGRF